MSKKLIGLNHSVFIRLDGESFDKLSAISEEKEWAKGYLARKLVQIGLEHFEKADGNQQQQSASV
jgi:hypothetical protein